MSSSVPNTFHLPASSIARLNTALSLAAFLSALVFGSLLHYKKIVKNSVAGYPEEWFPSVSATIGDWYPERSIFQIFCALTTGPRFISIALQYFQTSTNLPNSSLPLVVAASGIVRTLSCGGWMYITSNDDHDVHDFFMITYIICNIPWMLGSIATTSPSNTRARRKRIRVATAFFGSIIPLVYFFIQHKVHEIPGAYTRYSFFEWSLIMSDVLFDSVMFSEFKQGNLHVSFELFSPRVHYKEKQASGVTSSSLSDGGSISHDIATDVSAPVPALWPWRIQLSFASDIYLSYIFWSIFTSLVPTLFWFSVYELGIAGHELAFLATLSPSLFFIPGLLSWARSRGGTTTLHILSLLSLAAYAIPSPVGRLFAVTIGCIFAMLRQVSDWSRTDENGSMYQGVIASLGLMLSSVSKQMNYSHNPVWPFNALYSWTGNLFGFLLAIASIYEQHYRSVWTTRRREASKISKLTGMKRSKTSTLLKSALPFSALMFSLHSMLSDSSTLVSWTWTGYTDYKPNGPVPYQHGFLTILAQALGLLITTALSSSPLLLRMIIHPAWFGYGMISLYATATMQDWFGYFAALNFTVFLTGLTPIIMRPLCTSADVAKAYFLAMLTYIVLCLANVWTVAYAFVPGGIYLRERSDLVMIAQMACLAFAFNWPLRPQLQTGLQGLNVLVQPHVKTCLSFICLLSLLATLYHSSITAVTPFDAPHRMITAGIWTLHFGLNNHGRDSQRQVKQLISDMKVDVVGLLETDLHRTVFGNRDLTRVAAEELGYYVDIGPTGPKAHTWGAVLLSKFPIINTTHHLLPSPHGELAPAIEAVLDVYGTPITVVVSHNGQEEDPLDRELQSRELARIMAASYPRPVIFLGYVVTKPLAPQPDPYDILVSDGLVHDIDEEDGDRWCEYILYRGVYRTAYARLSRGSVTDTELQVGQFVVPRYGYGVTNETREARYLRSWKEELPEHHWMPLEYYGDASSGGVNGHYYHVFNTPLYYKIPEGAIL